MLNALTEQDFSITEVSRNNSSLIDYSSLVVTPDPEISKEETTQNNDDIDDAQQFADPIEPDIHTSFFTKIDSILKKTRQQQY